MSFTKRPEFRIVILQDQKTARIPKQYGDTYWKGTPNPIILILPNGFEEKIFWEESGSYFKVKIFGPNGLELINHPSIKSVNEKVVEAKKKGKEIIEVTDESEDDIETPMQAQKTRNGKRKFQGWNKGSRVQKAKKYPTNEAVNDEHPYFEVVMTKSYVHGNFMWIPKKFSREHLNNFNGSSTLRVGKDFTMKVNISFNDKNKKSMIVGGWKPFRKNYNLQVDDDCKFVMTKDRGPSFDVIINRARKGPSPTNLRGISRDDNIAKRRDIGETSRGRPRVHFVEDSGGNMMKHFTFKILVKVDIYPQLPKEFMNTGCDENQVELKMGTKSRFVKVKYYDSIKIRKFGEGWRPFIKECNLIGKFCVFEFFELIDEKKFVFNVSVERNNH
ncbi:B3 domain-containing transcription factor VRN1 [Trifolium repens]|nr:B3 domain-containing transcription factor VRN1 [Trifolium repens]